MATIRELYGSDRANNDEVFKALESWGNGADINQIHEDDLAEKTVSKNIEDIPSDLLDPDAPYVFPGSIAPSEEVLAADRALGFKSEEDASLEDYFHNGPQKQEPLLEAGDPEPLLEATNAAPAFTKIDVPVPDASQVALRHFIKPPIAEPSVESVPEPEHREILAPETRYNTLLKAALTALDQRQTSISEGETTPTAKDVTEFFTLFDTFSQEGLDATQLDLIQKLFTRAYDSVGAKPAVEATEPATPVFAPDSPIKFERPGSAEPTSIATQSIEFSVPTAEAEVEPIIAETVAPAEIEQDEEVEPAEKEPSKLEQLKGFWKGSREHLKDALRPSAMADKWKNAFNPYYKVAADLTTTVLMSGPAEWIARRHDEYKMKVATMSETELENHNQNKRLLYLAGTAAAVIYGVAKIQAGIESGAQHSAVADVVNHGHDLLNGHGSTGAEHHVGAIIDTSSPTPTPEATASSDPNLDIKISIDPGSTHYEVHGGGAHAAVAPTHEFTPSNATQHPHGLEAAPAHHEAVTVVSSVKPIEKYEGGEHWFGRNGLSAKTWESHKNEMYNLFRGDLYKKGDQVFLNKEGMVSKPFQAYVEKLRKQG